MTKRVVVGAHYGLSDWLIQRISALVVAAYTLILLGWRVAVPAFTYQAWTGLFARLDMKIFTFLAFAAVAWHGWVGMRDIYMDYLHCTALRLSLQVVTLLALAGYFFWAMTILWSLR